jgi:hypothetical protein
VEEGSALPDPVPPDPCSGAGWKGEALPEDADAVRRRKALAAAWGGAARAPCSRGPAQDDVSGGDSSEGAHDGEVADRPKGRPARFF